MEVMLVMFKADGARRDFPIKKSKVVVGRVNSCDLRIPLSSVSRQHCEITLTDDAVHIRDLGSSNGTFLNDTRITEVQLSAGDEIGIGPVMFVAVIDGSPSDIKPLKTVIDPATGRASRRPQSSFEEDAMTPTADIDAEVRSLRAAAGGSSIAEIESLDPMEDSVAALDDLAGVGLDDSDGDFPKPGRKDAGGNAADDDEAGETLMALELDGNSDADSDTVMLKDGDLLADSAAPIDVGDMGIDANEDTDEDADDEPVVELGVLDESGSGLAALDDSAQTEIAQTPVPVTDDADDASDDNAIGMATSDDIEVLPDAASGEIEGDDVLDILNETDDDEDDDDDPLAALEALADAADDDDDDEVPMLLDEDDDESSSRPPRKR